MNAIMIVALKSQSERYIPSTVQQDKLYVVPMYFYHTYSKYVFVLALHRRVHKHRHTQAAVLPDL